MNILENQQLVSARFAHGTPIPVYDDGFGPLWIHRDSMGVSGIVRAMTWEVAYSIAEDELFPAGDEDARLDRAKIESMPEGEDRNNAEACWDEAYGYRGAGERNRTEPCPTSSQSLGTWRAVRPSRKQHH